MHLWAQRRGAC